MKIVNCRKVPSDFQNIYIGRPSIFGNPFRMRIDSEEERTKVIEDYRIWFGKEVDRNPEFRQKVLELRGHDLACYCPPKRCHGDVIIDWLKTHNE